MVMDRMTIERVRVECILLKPSSTCGMNYMLIGSIAQTLRNSQEDPDPIDLREIWPGMYRVLDGRHRFFASVIAGRPDVLARVRSSLPHNRRSEA